MFHLDTLPGYDFNDHEGFSTLQQPKVFMINEFSTQTVHNLTR